MFTSVETLLQKANATEIHFLWVKFFTDSKSMPKNFLTHFPQFKENVDVFKFTRTETKVVKKAITNITEKGELQKTLIELFNFDEKISSEDLEVFKRVSNFTLTKDNKKSVGFIFRHAIRIFAKIVYQIPKEISNVIDKNMPMSFILDNLHKIIFFFSLFEGKKFMAFHTILLPFLSHFSFRFDEILAPTVPIQMQEACLTFMGALVSCSRVYLSEYPGQDAPIINFITQQFDKISIIMNERNISKPIAVAIRTTISSLVPYVQQMTSLQCENLSCISLQLISTVLKSNNLDTTEIYQTCVICMKLYNQSCRFESGHMKKFQFSSIILFIIWIITTCTDAILEDVRELPPIVEEPKRLGPASRADYFTKYVTISESKNLVISRRLSSVAEIILSICKHYKDPSPFVANLIDSIKEQEETITPEKYRTFVAFVLYLIGKVPENIVNSAVNNNWALLLSPIIFPPDTTVPSDVRLRNTVLNIVLRTFIIDPQSRKTILYALAQYFDKSLDSGKAYFMTLLNSLLIVEDTIDFINILSTSNLMKKLVKLAHVSLMTFDFLRVCALQQPIIMLTCPDMMNLCIDLIDDLLYQDSIFSMFVTAFSVIQYDKSKFSSIGTMLKLISKRILTINSDLAMKIVEIVICMAPNWSEDFIMNSQFLKEFIDIISIIPVNDYSNEIFMRLIQQYINIVIISPLTFDLMTQPDLTLYNNLKKAAAKRTEESDDGTNLLFEFMYSNPYKTERSHFLRNFRALEVLMEWSKGSVKEKDILLRLAKLAFMSRTNIYQMNYACVPEHILGRLRAVGNNKELITDILQLYSVLVRSGFTSAVLYESIRLMRSDDFEYPNLILSNYYHLMTTKKERGPPCFFHFEGTATGIFGPSIVIPEQALFVTSICFDKSFETDIQPVAVFNSKAGELVALLATRNNFYLLVNNSKVIGTCPVETDKWMQIVINFSAKGISVFIDGKLDIESNPIPLGTITYDILVAANSTSLHDIGLMGDVGPTYMLKGSDMSKIAIEMLPSEVEEIFDKNLLLMYSPKTTQKTKVLNVSNEAPTADFRGLAVPFISNIIDVMSSVGAVPNLIPIIQRAGFCEHCTGPHDEICPYCHSLATKNGEELICTLLNILLYVFQHSQDVQRYFKSIRGYRLLCGFLTKVSKECISSDVFNAIIGLFCSSKDIELARQAIEDILLNFDFIATLNVDSQIYLFSTLLMDAFQNNPEPFISFPSLDFIIYRAMLLTEDKEPISDLVWQFLTTVISKAPTPQLCTNLIAIIANNKDPLILTPVLDTLLLLINSSWNSISRIFSIFDYYLPFAFTMACEDPAVKSKTLQIIQCMNPPSDVSIEVFVAYCILSLSGTNIIGEEKVINRLSRMVFGTADGKMQMIQTLPLLVSFIQQIPKEEAKEHCKKFTSFVKSNNSSASALFDLTNWYFWVMKLYTTVYELPAEVNEFIEPFMVAFGKQLKEKASTDLTEFFTYIDIISLEYKADFSIIKNTILCSLTSTSNKESIKIIIKEIFKYLFIHQSVDDPIEVESMTPKEIEKLLPEHKYLPSKVTFGILVDENGSWLDIEIAKAVISLIPNLDDFQFEIIDGVPINSFEAVAYIAANVAKFNKMVFVKLVTSIVDRLGNVNYDSAYKSASILYASVIRNCIKLDEVDRLLFYVNNYCDDSDSPEYQYFMFEDKFGSQIKRLLNQCVSNQSNLMQTMLERVYKILGVTETSKLSSIDKSISLVEGIVRSTKPQFYQPLKGAMDRFMGRQKRALKIDREISKKHTTSFLKELTLSGGPWADEKMDEHFMASNYISSRGKRIILKINHEFDDHRKASELRDSGKSNALAAISIPRLKTITSDNIVIKHDTFKANVQLLSIKHTYSGEINVDSGNITFDCRGNENNKHVEIHSSSIEFILSRKQNYQEVACEIFGNCRKSFYFIFSTPEDRNTFYKVLSSTFPQKQERKESGKFNFFRELRIAENGRIQMSPSSEIIKKMNLTEKWVTEKITTYEYLYFLNILAGRSFNDLSQYPIYPWIIKDYESKSINLNNPAVYRDLSKPIGAMNQNRLENLKTIYKEFPDVEESCLYRSHFSSMASVSSFLIRVEPFTSLHILLQEGRFDVPGRLFSSIEKEWKSVTSEENDFRELIPEFFTFPEFLSNNSHYDLGYKRETNEKVDDVILPPWASSPWEFVEINRRALESEITSKSINKWIDLIFGVTRCSEEENNIFHPLSYPEKVRGPEITTERIHNHCMHFGVCPDQLFFEPHPQRVHQKVVRQLNEIRLESDVIALRKGIAFLANGKYIDFNEEQPLPKSLPGNFGSLLCVSKKYSLAVFRQSFDNFVSVIDLETKAVRTVTHEVGPIISAAIINGNYLVTGGSDCSLRVWVLPKLVPLRVSTLHSDQVIAVAGCLETGLIASLDKRGLLIIESLHKGKFFCSKSVSINSNSPMLELLKSGLVIFVDHGVSSSKITAFDTKFDVVAETELQGRVTELRKTSDGIGGEFVVVAVECSIVILETPSLRTIVTFQEEQQCLHVCSMNNRRELLCGIKDAIKPIDF